MNKNEQLQERIRTVLASEESPLTPDRIFELVPEADSLAELGKALRAMANAGEVEAIDTGRKGHRAHPVFAYQLLGPLVKPTVTAVETDSAVVTPGPWSQLLAHPEPRDPKPKAARPAQPTAANPATPASAAGRPRDASSRPVHAIGADEETQRLMYEAPIKANATPELMRRAADAGEHPDATAYREQLEDATRLVQSLREGLASANREIDRLRTEMHVQKNELTGARASNDELRADNGRKASAIGSLMQQLEAANQRLSVANTALLESEQDRVRLARAVPLAQNTHDALAVAKAVPGEMVNHPAHYNTGSIEVIDAIEDWGLGFNAGNAVKYIARHQHKGKPLEDLQKAAWYIDRAIQQMEKKGAQNG